MKHELTHLTGGPPTALAQPVTSRKKLRIESSSLFQGEREIVIIHQKEEYNLRITRNEKLILTK
jgi:hemin uptake protein HemP